ncbi:unnamed protein product [Mytilus coruscus]|uniref:Uncharacterized protein n=1 Tax=Mytilus coruscus TaxID=42192 RepID=A0A6J8BW48_MYTCO|nr:unnamed protein product [Mytilus coruscus]
MTTTKLTTPASSTIKTSEQTPPLTSKMTTTGQTTPLTSTMTTTERTTPLTSIMTTTERTTPSTSTMRTTELTLSSTSTITATEQTTPSTYTMTTTKITTLPTSTMTTTDMKTPPTSAMTTIAYDRIINTISEKLVVTSIYPFSPDECLCPCSKVAKGKWDFFRGMSLTLDQLRELLKPDLDLMKKELSINKSNTSRMRRSKISAPDDRVSATSVGYVGVVFICLITVIIVTIDILGCNVAKSRKRS